MKLLKIASVCCLVVISAWLANLFFFYFPKHFDLHFYEYSPKDFSSEINTEDFDPEVQNILNQPFYYLDSGNQMVAFESSDHQYVLKFFHARPPLKPNWFLRWQYWKKYFSLHWFSHIYGKKDLRLKKIYGRTKLAFDYLKDETALVFVYLGQPLSFDPRVTLWDSHHKKHEVPLKHMYFIVQKKVELIKNRLHRLIHENNLVAAHMTVNQVKQLLKDRAGKGITDRIQEMHNNFGFLNERAIQLDFGRIHLDPVIALNPEEEQRRVVTQFETWLKNTFPVLAFL